MKRLGLRWKWIEDMEETIGDFRGKVFVLKSTKRTTRTATTSMSLAERYTYHVVTPWTMIPSRDWITEANDENKLSVRHAQIEYPLPNGEVVYDTFDRDIHGVASYTADFLECHELGEEHAGSVKATIKNAFAEKRADKQLKKDLLETKYGRDALEAIQVVKVYPGNECVAGHKVPYVNKYYGKASNVY